MSSATATQTSSNRRAHSRAQYRSRPTSRVSKRSEQAVDQDAATARFSPSTEIESEIDVELTSSRPTRNAMTTELNDKVHHHSATKPLKKLSRAGSQISVVEVDDGWPTAAVEVASAKHDVDIGSWRRRTAKTAHPVLSPGAVSRSLLRDQETKPDPSRRQSAPGSGRAEDQNWTRTHQLPEQAADGSPGLSRTVGAPTAFTESQRRASVPVALASYPHASVPSVPFTQLPDLNRIRPIRPALVAEQLLLSEPCQLPRTREFALAPPPYSDADIPPPTPYNEAFPHPLTSYASPGVNASTVKLSGYDIELAKLMQIDRPKALGTILATCDRPGITAPTLAKHLRSYIPDGNGIPGFDNEGAARAALGPVGAAICRGDERLNELTGGDNGGSGIQPVFTPALNHMPPRLAAQARAETRMREAHSLSMSSASEYSYRPLTPPASPRVAYPSIKVPGAEDYHTAALRRASVVSDLAAGRPSHQLPSDYFQPRSYPVVPPTADMPHPPSPSSFHKTELCPAFEETGQCKYGKGCQFAHGLCELRLPLSRSAFTFPAPFPQSHQQQLTSPSGHPLTGPATSPKTELRRASAPHSNLGTVQETEDDHFPFPIFTPGRRSSEITPPAEVSPGAYDRPIRQASIARLTVPRQALDVARDLASSYSSDMPSTPTQTPISTSFNTAIATPSDRLSPGAYRERQSHVVHPQASNSSLSSIGGYLSKDNHIRSDESTPTRLSTYHDPNNTVPEGAYLSPSHSRAGQPASPVGGGDAASTGSWGSGPKTKSNSTSATVDFSTGRSIWC